MVANVVGNAVQYTSEGSIQVSLSGEDGRVVVEVIDTGVGLAPDGTGVGLAIAMLIVRAHGGTITARSGGLDLGTCLRIELPAEGGAST